MNWSHALHWPAGWGDTTLWSLLSLVVFFGIVFFLGAHKKVIKGLDDRAQNIQNELEEARRLREEAQELLASFQRRQREAEQEAETIVEHAQKEAARLANQAREDLAERLERRARMAENRIAQAEVQAEKNVRSAAADLAIIACERFLQKELTDVDHDVLVNKGFQDMTTHWPRA